MSERRMVSSAWPMPGSLSKPGGSIPTTPGYIRPSATQRRRLGWQHGQLRASSAALECYDLHRKLSTRLDLNQRPSLYDLKSMIVRMASMEGYR